MGIGEVHAVAVAGDDALRQAPRAPLDEMRAEVGNPGDWHRDTNAFIGRGEPPAIRAAARAARDADAGAIHLRPRIEVVERPDAVPQLHSSWTVAARVPPPHFFA